MSEIVVTSQQQLDSLPNDYHGRIYIKFGTPYDMAVVRRKYDFASVEARDNSSIVAWENSSVEAFGNSQISQKSDASKIKTSGNARIVRDPCSIDEYVGFYGIENSNGKAQLFKAVRKRDGLYRSDWDSDFVYTIGKSVVADGFCTDPNEDCGHGIHMAYLNVLGLISQSSKLKWT